MMRRVTTRIVTKQGQDVPVAYSLRCKGDHWVAYDVNVEGVSLVANYRSQFHNILTTSGYDELVKRMRARLAQPERSPW